MSETPKAPSVKFADLGLSSPILKKLQREGYETPTPIQAQAIPPILAGKDVVGLAQTGTGKTAAFTLPILHTLDKKYYADGKTVYDRPIRVLVLTPTRELAVQIDKAVRGYGENLMTRSGCVVGGVHAHKQKKVLKAGIDVLVATPGRLEDLQSQGVVDLHYIDTVILDEADQMLDIGFMPAIKRILGLTPKDRQTLLFSATMPRQIRELSNRYMKKPVEITVSTVSSTAERVQQSVMFLAQPQKTNALIELVKKHKGERIIVFTRTKRGADRVAKRLNSQNLGAAAIHGNRSQNQRTKALDAFRTGDVPVLVATDVAARGIDIPGVELVVNFDLPQVAEAYVHRIGRTARAGKSGLAIMFCNDEEMKMLSDIERIIKKNIAVMNADGTLKPESKWNPTERTYGRTEDSNNNAAPKKSRRNRTRKKPAAENAPQQYEQAHNPNTNKAKGSGEKRKPRNKQDSAPSNSKGQSNPKSSKGAGKRKNRPGSRARKRQKENSGKPQPSQ